MDSKLLDCELHFGILLETTFGLGFNDTLNMSPVEVVVVDGGPIWRDER